MRPFAGTLATLFSVILLATGTAALSYEDTSAIGGGVLGAGFGTMLAGWHFLVGPKKKD